MPPALRRKAPCWPWSWTGGTPQQVPVSPGTKVLGTWNGLFVCSRTVPPAAVAQLRPGALEETYREAEYNATGTEIFLKSPVTGAEQADHAAAVDDAGGRLCH